MRGRYLSLQLEVDGCRSTLPSAKQAAFPHNFDGTVQAPHFNIATQSTIEFAARLSVENNRLVAVRSPESDGQASGQLVMARAGQPCEQMRLVEPVNFYLSEQALAPLPLAHGAELWVEVTVPPRGAPRPIQLALKHDRIWQPLAFQ